MIFCTLRVCFKMDTVDCPFIHIQLIPHLCPPFIQLHRFKRFLRHNVKSEIQKHQEMRLHC